MCTKKIIFIFLNNIPSMIVVVSKTQLNSTQLTTPKEKEWFTRGKKL